MGQNGGNGRVGLSYVLEDMATRRTSLTDSTNKLRDARMPDFVACPAGGEEFHQAIANNAVEQSRAIDVILQLETIRVRRELDRDQEPLPGHDQDGQPEITVGRWRARGVAAMWPLVVIACVALFIAALLGKTP